MARRCLQIILLLALLNGVAAQALACGSLMQDSHACCQTLTTETRLAAQTQHSDNSLPPCCQTSAPQPLPVEVRESKPVRNELPDGVLPFVTIHYYHVRQGAIIPRPPDDYSPPSFLLHHALLI